MKFFVLLSLFALNACTSPVEVESKEEVISSQKTINDKVNTRISQALAIKDYRLLGLSGRRITAPGIVIQEMSGAIKRCGIQLLPHSGDVLKTEADRARRKSLFQLAEQFNQQMYLHCLQNTSE